MKTYDIEEINLGDAGKGDRIIFCSIEDLQSARTEIDDGKGIFVRTSDGLITELPHRMIYQKIYDGTIKLSARVFHQGGVKK
jgi:hypothetical protein